MAKIIWSPEANLDYLDNIEYVLRRWTNVEAIDFINKTEEIIAIITHKPKTFQATEYKNVHAVPVIPQITIYYRILDKKTVEIVRVWNNNKDPKSLSL